jgi:hypothetical protein
MKAHHLVRKTLTLFFGCAALLATTFVIGCGTDMGQAPSNAAAAKKSIDAAESSTPKAKGRGRSSDLANFKSIKGRALGALESPK